MENIIWILRFCVLLIPGILVYLTVGCLFPIHRSRVRKLLLLFGCTVSGNMVIYFGDWDNLPPSILIFMVSVWLGCKGSSMKRITLGMMLVSTISAYSALLDNLPDFTLNPELYMGIRIAGCLTLYLCMRKFSPDKEFELGRTLWRVLLFLTAIPMGIVLGMVLFTPYGRGKNIYFLLFLAALSLFSIVGILGTVMIFDRQKRMEEAQNLAEMNRKYYEVMEQQNFETRRIRHDLANHLQVLAALPENEKNDYIQELAGNPLFTATLKYCEDETVNVILRNKASLMEQKGIAFHIRTEIKKRLPMEKTDICAIFGNLLDNAIEAVQNYGGERRISLEARFGKGMLVLRVENPAAEYEIHGEGTLMKLPATTKADAASHGYGLKSVRSTVEKYGGKLELGQENGVFKVFVYCMFENKRQNS